MTPLREAPRSALRALFLGPWRYWVLLAAIVAVLWGFGQFSVHVRHFVPFSLAVLALAAAGIAIVLQTYRRGEPVTREPFDDLVGDE